MLVLVIGVSVWFVVEVAKLHLDHTPLALQLCALRFRGRSLSPGEVIPEEITSFLAAQLGLRDEDLGDYAVREETRHEHMAKGLDIRPHRKRMVEEDLDERFKDPNDDLRLVFVCAMWITGFDVPSCSTIYLDKPMKNHTLMQTIARAKVRWPLSSRIRCLS
jgi:hypothetical protein